MTHTALQSDGVGLVVLGQPADVEALLLRARELDSVAVFVTDAGLFSVDSHIPWRLTGLERE